MKTKKQLIHQLRNGCKKFLQKEKNRKNLFAGIGVITSAAVIFYQFHPALFFIGFFTATIIYNRLNHANIDIPSPSIRLGWAGLMFAAFYLPAVWLTVEDEITQHVFGLSVSFCLCVFLYVIIPAISYRLKLNRQQEGYDFEANRTRNNGVVGNLLMYGIIVCLWAYNESEQTADARFLAEPYIPVIKWEKEYWHGNTYYIVDCEKGRFSVSVEAHPEIRDINPATRVRILATPSSKCMLQIQRLEIKNR